jgi:flagellar basal body-associated protein FliL
MCGVCVVYCGRRKRIKQMIPVVERGSRGLLVLYRVLIGVVLLLILLLLVGTFYALVIRGPGARQGGESGRISSSPEGAAGTGEYTGEIFTGIGRIRALSAEPQAATVILSVVFPYTPEDRAFSEELALKIGRFRGITAEYFAAFTTEKLREKGEEAIKEELRQQYNAILTLGSINRLYFNDYMILE